MMVCENSSDADRYAESEMEIIFHKPNEQSEISPFDKAIQKVINDESIRIACPYIGLEYFQNIINSCKDWKLLSDINALFDSCYNTKAIIKMKEFVIGNHERIRHLSGLHAKVIISPKNIFLGSANFTKNGITNNNEMSIIINDKLCLDEISNWFDSWWNIAEIINIEQFNKNIDTNIELLNPIEKTKIDILSSQKYIHTQYVSVDKSEILSGKNEEYLINFIKSWGLLENKDWSESYLHFAKYILTKYHIDENDTRLCVSFRTNPYRIAITIGQRYILGTDFHKKYSIELIMPLDNDRENAQTEGCFLETYFTKNKNHDASWLHYNKGIGSFNFNEKTLQEWEKAVENELGRSKKTSYKKYHQLILYKFIMDENYRNEIVEKGRRI